MKVISSSPVRIGLFGGGSDTSPYSDLYGGAVINMAINIRQEIEMSDEVGEYKYIPGANPKFYEAFFKRFNFTPGSLKVSFPERIESGLGSSASAAVTLVAALAKLTNKKLSREEIALMAWDVEVNDLGMFGGLQDQYAAAFGGLNYITFGKEGARVIPFQQALGDELQRYMLLFDTRITRTDTKIQESMKNLTDFRKKNLDIVKSFATHAYEILNSADPEVIGTMLDSAWEFKKKTNNVTTKEIDSIYQTAIESGAWGGKLCGSGGGGCMIFMAPLYKHTLIKNNLSNMGCKWIDFEIDWNGVSTRFI